MAWDVICTMWSDLHDIIRTAVGQFSMCWRKQEHDESDLHGSCANKLISSNNLHFGMYWDAPAGRNKNYAWSRDWAMDFKVTGQHLNRWGMKTCRFQVHHSSTILSLQLAVDNESHCTLCMSPISIRRRWYTIRRMTCLSSNLLKVTFVDKQNVHANY